MPNILQSLFEALIPIAAVFPHAVGSIRGVEAHRHTVLALGSDSFGELDERRWSKACRRQLEGLERAFHVRVSVRVSSGVIDDLFPTSIVRTDFIRQC